MSYYYSPITAEDVLYRVTRQQYESAKFALHADTPEWSHDFELTYHEDAETLFIHTGPNGTIDDVPDKFWNIIGAMLKERGLPYLEFGQAMYCDTPYPGSCWGTAFRVYPDGTIKHPNVIWPDC